ncbi:MAG: FkbM family methyltransferase [Bryobacteraceae bacterium]|nr:FkbM family methyltransferase [Bryobacteraceae bacterium]MDW8379133.1 FkbM family methyltransferase [Bryobacterales bacterium]
MASTILRLPLRLVPRDAVIPILSGPLRGKKWVAGSSVASCWLGIYERAKLEQMQASVPPGGVVYDVGAQSGYHTLLASRLVGRSGRVYAFEPLPRNYEMLVKHLSLNEIFNVEPVRAAVSDTDGELCFDPGPGFMAGRLSEQGTLRVRSVTLDHFLSSQDRIRPPDVIKIDVEGAELRVLRGARQMLAQWRPTVLLDTHDFLGGANVGLHEACARFLAELGYQLECQISRSPNQASSILAQPPSRPVACCL